MTLIKCCVPGCGENRRSSDIRHRFPNPKTDLIRFKKWIDVLNNATLLNIEPANIYASNRVCHLHFEEKYISRLSNRLLPNSLPTLNLQGKINVLDICNLPSTSSSLEPPRDPELISSHIQDVQESLIQKRATVQTKDLNPATPYKVLKNIAPKQTVTPRKHKLYRAMQYFHKKYSIERNRKNSLRRRLFDAEKFSKESNIELAKIEELNALAAMIIKSQIRENKKSKYQRRFTLEEKIFAITLFKQSPRSYRLLSKIFILPSKSTMNRLLSRVDVGPGINKFIFKSLKTRVDTMEEADKYVAVMFDEMSIMPMLTFNEQKGAIYGFQEIGQNERTADIADHVLVFMVRGLRNKWKSPISYHFVGKGGAKTVVMKNLLKDILQELLKLTLKPITSICDQYNAPVFTALMNETKEDYLRHEKEYRHGFFEINNFKVYPILDPPHLIKGIRNNLLTKDLHFLKNKVKRIAKWEHIKRLYEYDAESETVDGLRALPHIRVEHIYGDKMKKMKVKHATQIFSQRLASTLKLASKIDTGHKIGVNVEDTAELLLFFDQLFDSFNGNVRVPIAGKVLRCGISDKSDHLRFWKEDALPLLSSMRFQKVRPRDQERPPSLKHWAFNIRNIKSIWNVLKENNFQYLLPRHINQDPIENAFGQLRSFGGQYTNPSPAMFISIFKILLTNSTVGAYKNSFNCEDDECSFVFSSFKQLLTSASPKKNTDLAQVEFIGSAPTELVNHSLSQKLNRLSGNYVAGFILKKIKKTASCSSCKKSLYSETAHPDNILIAAREYGGAWAKRLCYPTDQFVLAFYDIFNIITFYLNREPQSNFLTSLIMAKIRTRVNFDFISCTVHKASTVNLICKITIRTLVHNWCKSVNQLLQGKSRNYRGVNKVKLEAKTIYIKKLKRKKQRSDTVIFN